MMKKNIRFCVLGLISMVVLAGCTATSAEYGAKGAATGAVSASFVGAMTDLIIDGKVDSDRLTRNAVGGAVAGGTAGAVVGYKKDKAAEKAAASAPVPVSPSHDRSALQQKIGPQNFSALQKLVACQHADAYRIGIETAKSDNKDFREAGLVLQAMVDFDRGNSDGVSRIMQTIIESVDSVSDQAAAEQGLNDLQQKLEDERRAQGKNPSCQ